MTKKLSYHDAGELFEIQMRGAIARMLHVAGINPSERQWDMMHGNTEITLRDIGEIACECGFVIEVATFQRDRETEVK